MNVLHLFSGYGTLTNALKNAGFSVTSLDCDEYRGCPAPDHKMNFMDFDFYQYNPGYFQYIFIGLPCTAFSKASGNFHFKNHLYPLTKMAAQSIEMIYRVRQLLDYFNNSIFIIENPAGGIVRNWFFRFYLNDKILHSWLVYQAHFGHVVPKATELFTNSETLVLSNAIYRPRGRSYFQRFDSLSDKKRNQYPVQFCEFLIQNFFSNEL